MENKDILRTLVQADRDARERVTAAERRERLLSGSTAEIYAAAEKKAMAAARQETDKIRTEAEAAASARVAALDRESAEAVAKLDAAFRERKAECIERIFQMVVDIS